MPESPLPAPTARILEMAAEIAGEPEADELAFLHSVLATCGLPYRSQGDARDYTRTNGRASLIVSSGHMIDPQTGKPVLQGIPYGAKPRLLLIHLCTEAVRRQSPTIPVADSMTAFMKELGLAATGGKKGSIGRFKEQLNRLAASRMQLVMDFGDRATLYNPAPVIRKIDVWFPDNPQQKVLWPSEIEMAQEFFENLVKHALPLDPRAIRGLQHSARALDIYTWLTHRLPRVRSRNGDKVSWAALQTQFGPEMKNRARFKQDFNKAMRQVLVVYPKARVEPEDGGLRLKRSSPPIRRLQG